MRNFIILRGILERDPEMKVLSTGKVCNLRLATTKTWNMPDGIEKQSTQWHDVSAWGVLAEKIVSRYKKGSEVGLAGELCYSKAEKGVYPYIKAEMLTQK